MPTPTNQPTPILATTAPDDSLPPDSAIRTPQSAIPSSPYSELGNRNSEISSLPLDQAVEHLTIPQRTALQSLISGSFVTTAAKAAGVHRATVHRWLKSNPIFRAAYNAWEQESKTNTMSRLLSVVHHAIDAVTWSIQDGDGRLAYTLLKDLGLLSKIQESLTEPDLLRRKMQLERLDLLHSLNVDQRPNPSTPPPGRLK